MSPGGGELIAGAISFRAEPAAELVKTINSSKVTERGGEGLSWAGGENCCSGDSRVGEGVTRQSPWGRGRVETIVGGPRGTLGRGEPVGQAGPSELMWPEAQRPRGPVWLLTLQSTCSPASASTPDLAVSSLHHFTPCSRFWGLRGESLPFLPGPLPHVDHAELPRPMVAVAASPQRGCL